MKNFFTKTVEYLLYAFIFLLPWQTRWMWYEGRLNGQFWEYGTFSLYATDIILLGAALIALFVYRGRVIRPRGHWVILLGLMLVSLVSAMIAKEQDMAWYAVGKFAEGFILFWLVFRIRISWRKISFFLVTSGLVQSVLGIWQFFSQKILANKWLGLAEHDPGVLGDLVVETTSGRWLRAYGSMPHPNVLAGFLAVCLLVCLSALVFYAKKQNIMQKIFFWSSLAVMQFAFILTFSRSAWLALLLCYLVMLAVKLYQKNKELFIMTAKAGLVLLIITTMTVIMLPDLWQTRITGGRLEQMSVVQRADYYDQANELIKDYWYRGVGLNNFTQATYELDSAQEAWYYQPVHNIYYLSAVELGVIGGILLVVLFFWSVWIFYRHVIKINSSNIWLDAFGLALLCLFIIGLFDHYLWTLSAGILLFWLILAIYYKISENIVVEK